eukprot:scaffold5682_cov140-Cylindrotheca_fusiformis.AAC.6
MARSVVRPRRSFGGSHGVWWRNKKAVPPPTSSNELSKAVGWDEDLCRPIYPPSNNNNENSNKEASEEGEETRNNNDDADANASTGDRKKGKKLLKSRLAEAPIKRCNKTFGGRKRTPVSFLLLNANQEIVSSPSSTNSSSCESKNNGLPTTSSKADATEEESTSTLDFTAEDKEKPAISNQKKKRHILTQEENALLKAKQYFEQLDTTQTLTIENSGDASTATSSTKNPTSIHRSKITRTSRKVNLTSPGFSQEYKAYAKASQESGVSPLSKHQYAYSRREYFRKTELFDGFFDEL